MRIWFKGKPGDGPVLFLKCSVALIINFNTSGDGEGPWSQWVYIIPVKVNEDIIDLKKKSIEYCSIKGMGSKFFG